MPDFRAPQASLPSEQHLHQGQEEAFPDSEIRSRDAVKWTQCQCSEGLSRVSWIQNWEKDAVTTGDLKGFPAATEAQSHSTWHMAPHEDSGWGSPLS